MRSTKIGMQTEKLARTFKPPTYLYKGKIIQCIGEDETAKKGFSKISDARLLKAIQIEMDQDPILATENYERLKDILRPLQKASSSSLGRLVSKIKMRIINKRFTTSAQFAELVENQLDTAKQAIKFKRKE